MAYRIGCTASTIVLGLALSSAGCGGNSSAENSSNPQGGAVHTGGRSSPAGAPSAGGSSAQNSTGVGGTSMHRSETTAAGALNSGGTSTLSTKSSGGASATGGNESTGGALATGGHKSSGGASLTGGNSASGGASLVGGSKGTGGRSSSGGSTNENAGGAGTSLHSGGSSAGGMGVGGTSGSSLQDFCQGTQAKVKYQGHVVAAPATNFESGLVMDCCESSGVNLHATPTLGFDFVVEVLWKVSGARVEIGTYDLGGTNAPFRASVRRTSDTSIQGTPVSGSGQLLTSFHEAPWYLGLCIEVTDITSDLSGTQLYVPRVGIHRGIDHRSRLEMYLLQDAAMTPIEAAALSPASLALEANPALDLADIAYYSQATGEVGLNPDAKLGNVLLTRIGPDVVARPFVLVADDIQIYMGSVGTLQSAAAANQPVGPFIVSKEVSDGGFTIRAPMSGTDPRNDARVLQVLEATSRLIP